MNQNLVKQKLGNHQSLARHWEEATNSLYISSIGWSDSLLLVREEIMGRKLNLNQNPPKKTPQIYGYGCRRSKKHRIREEVLLLTKNGLYSPHREKKNKRGGRGRQQTRQPHLKNQNSSGG
jgi:hypothetical protein